MFPTKPSKYFFQARLIERLEREAHTGRRIRLLEIGSGTSEIALNVLERFPHIDYVGLEPDGDSVARARARLNGSENAVVIQGLGYAREGHPELETPFDIVFSLSVLEHVKRLREFIDLSIAMARPGGEVIHLYDLGHALYPKGLKEWIQTRVCATKLLRFVPEDKVARYLATDDVRRLLERGCDIQEITFNNMPDHVRLLKRHMTEDLMQAVVAFENATFQNVEDLAVRERLYPSICFWTTKRTA